MAEPPPPPPNVVNWFKQHYPRPRVDLQWLTDCYNWVITSLPPLPASPTPADFQPLIQSIQEQLLLSDLSDSMIPGTGLPLHIGNPETDNATLTGPGVLVQIVSMTDIGVSAYKLDQTRGVREERIRARAIAGAGAADGQQGEDGEEEPDEDVIGEGPIPKYTRSMLKLELSDGTTTIQAIEYKPLPELVLGETELGFKMLLKNVPIRRGIAFLDPQCVVMKGYRQDELDERREINFVKGLRVRMGLPIDDEGPGAPPQPPPPGPPPLPPAVIPPPNRTPLRQISREPSPIHPDFFEDESTRKRRVPSASASTRDSPWPSTASTLAGGSTSYPSTSGSSSTLPIPSGSRSSSGSGAPRAQVAAPTTTTSPYFSRTSGFSNPPRTHEDEDAFLDFPPSPSRSRPVANGKGKGKPDTQAKGKGKYKASGNNDMAMMDVDFAYDFGHDPNDTDIGDEDELEAFFAAEAASSSSKKPNAPTKTTSTTSTSTKPKPKPRERNDTLLTWPEGADGDRSSEYGDDLDVAMGSAFFADLDRVEQEAFKDSQEGEGSQQPQGQVGGGGSGAGQGIKAKTTTAAGKTTGTRQARPPPPASSSSRPLARGFSPSIEIINDAGLPEVITIDSDDDSDGNGTDIDPDKENIPLPTRNVRRRTDNGPNSSGIDDYAQHHTGRTNTNANASGTGGTHNNNRRNGHTRNSSGSGPRSSQPQSSQISSRTGRRIIMADNSADIIDISD